MKTNVDLLLVIFDEEDMADRKLVEEMKSDPDWIKLLNGL